MSWTRLSNFTFPFHLHALERDMATHSSVLAWRISGSGESGGLPSMGSHRIGHNWSNLAAAMIIHIELPVMSNRITKAHSLMGTAVTNCKTEIIFQGGKVAGPNSMGQQQVAQIPISPTRIAPVPLLKLVPMAILQRDIPIWPVVEGLTNGC